MTSSSQMKFERCKKISSRKEVAISNLPAVPEVKVIEGTWAEMSACAVGAIFVTNARICLLPLK